MRLLVVYIYHVYLCTDKEMVQTTVVTDSSYSGMFLPDSASNQRPAMSLPPIHHQFQPEIYNLCTF